VYGQVYNSRSPLGVALEMHMVKRTIDPDHIWFCDDIFGLRPGWIASFREEVTRLDAQIPFKCLSRADLLLKGDTIRDLRSSGCTSTWIGAESGSQKILDAMEKGTTIEQIYEASRLLQESGIRVGFFLQYGYPGEEWNDIRKTLKMVEDCRPDDIGVSVSYPLPGTRFYETVKRELGMKDHWVDSEDLDVLHRGLYGKEFYRLLHRVTHKRLRLREGHQRLREFFKNPAGLSRNEFRRILSAAYHLISLPILETRLAAMRHPKTDSARRGPLRAEPAPISPAQ
jgi:radical SAM superfamily enzyme YgiQ (UPF0313 family)